MISRIVCASPMGVEAVGVQVEAYISNGLPVFNIVGLPDAAVTESKERVRAAINNSGVDFPMRRILVNLAPADVRKAGPLYDLPIAVAVLTAASHIPRGAADGYLFAGELGLDGAVRPVPGGIVLAESARSLGLKGIVVAREQTAEARLVPGIQVLGAANLRELIQWLSGAKDKSSSLVAHSEAVGDMVVQLPSEALVDLSDIRGQAHAKRAIEIAATGGHSLLMVGPPGSGKSMLAQALPGILPPLTEELALEVTRVYSVAGLLEPDRGLIATPPFRAPHHTTTLPGLIGGGAHKPRPGEISLSHGGVLFLDEMREFSSAVLDGLRQPLEEKMVSITRGMRRFRFPADFMLVGATNPCKCGFLGDRFKQCSCPSGRADQYFAKLSGPMMDRIDMHVEVPRLSGSELSGLAVAEPTATVRARVASVRQDRDIRSSGSEFSRPTAPARGMMIDAIERLGLSARALNKVGKIAGTISQMSGEGGVITEEHVAEALQYRPVDRSSIGARRHS